MARNDPQVNFRIPQELKDMLENSAKDNGRSITQELINRLEHSFGLSDKPKRKIIFTEWKPGGTFPEISPMNNEAVRRDCAQFMTDFFKSFPEHEFIQLESITERNNKGHEIIMGIRVWYSYPG